MRGQILDEAKALITGDRQETYGPPVACFERAAAIFRARTDHQVTAAEMVIAMQCVKQARRKENPMHRDSYVDDAGYVGIEYECVLAFPAGIVSHGKSDRGVQVPQAG